jgi:Ser/Thr protein kinase RdoA (MazF antagonist)
MQDFFSLLPDALLGAVESALGGGARATGRCFPLNSMENRVYDLELEDDRRVVAKFYRPGRWSRAAILQEHQLLAELVEAEVPVVAPLPLTSGSTLAALPSGIWFAVFPRMVGRSLAELDDEQLMQIGRLLARLHNVAAAHEAPERPILTPRTYGEPALHALLASGYVEDQLRDRYARLAHELLAAAEPLWSGVAMHRLHGDCHLGNLLWRREGLLFVDFDDLMTGPSVQDIWMVVRGRDEEARRQREVLLSGYEQLRAFDRRTLRLIEPLRGLRLIHYAAWVARRYADPIFPRTFPEFTTYQHWASELQALQEALSGFSAPSYLA